MGSKEFSSMEVDAIGEILNISLGASATAVSTMLNTRVDITTPTVSIVTAEEFSFANLKPAIGVEITYVSGLEGKNIMLLKRRDIRVIVELLMGMEIADEEFELDEMNVSAVCEVMNQMMGASSTALSEFLGKMVNISTPVSFEIAGEEEFKEKYFDEDEKMVVVAFLLKIDNKLESQFVNVMSTALAKELLGAFLPEEYLSFADEDEPEPEIAPAPAMAAAPIPAPAAPVPVMPMMPDMTLTQPLPQAGAMPMDLMGQMLQAQPHPQTAQAPVQAAGNDLLLQQQLAQQQMFMQQMMQQMQQMQEQIHTTKQPPANKMLNVNPLNTKNLSSSASLNEEQQENLDLVMGVSLELSVEIGRTKSLVKDILEYTKGTLIVLDKLAGDQVDLYINGQCIAKGDVVVVNDNFGIRITEVLKRPDLE